MASAESPGGQGEPERAHSDGHPLHTFHHTCSVSHPVGFRLQGFRWDLELPGGLVSQPGPHLCLCANPWCQHLAISVHEFSAPACESSTPNPTCHNPKGYTLKPQPSNPKPHLGTRTLNPKPNMNSLSLKRTLDPNATTHPLEMFQNPVTRSDQNQYSLA